MSHRGGRDILEFYRECVVQGLVNDVPDFIEKCREGLQRGEAWVTERIREEVLLAQAPILEKLNQLDAELMRMKMEQQAEKLLLPREVQNSVFGRNPGH